MICTFKVARVGKIYLFCKPACQKPQILKDFFKTWKMFGIKMLDIQIKCNKTETIIKRFKKNLLSQNKVDSWWENVYEFNVLHKIRQT